MKYIRLKIAALLGFFVHVDNSDVLNGPRVNHHIPRVSIQAIRPAVVALLMEKRSGEWVYKDQSDKTPVFHQTTVTRQESSIRQQ